MNSPAARPRRWQTPSCLRSWNWRRRFALAAGSERKMNEIFTLYAGLPENVEVINRTRKYGRNETCSVNQVYGRHQPSPAVRLPAPELPHRSSDQPRWVLDRLSRLRRWRRTGRDQGVLAIVAGVADRRRHRASEHRRESHVVPIWHEVLLRRRACARQDQPSQRRARAQLFPRERDRLHGDALRARTHIAATDPDAPGSGLRTPGTARVHAFAQRLAGGAHA